METGDLTYLYIDGRDSGKYTNRLDPIWEDLMQQKIDEFGVSDEMISLMRLKLKIVKLRLKFVESSPRDLSILNHINIQEEKLKERTKSEGIKFGKILILLQRAQGFRINPEEFTVYEWYYAVNQLSDDSDKGQ